MNPMFPLPDLSGLPQDLREQVEKRRRLHVYQMIMHSPQTAPAFLAMSDALRLSSSLPALWRELAILRVGNAYGAAYEIHHHERIARAADMPEAWIQAAKSGVLPAGHEDAGAQLILSLCNEVLASHGLALESRDRALTQLSVQQLADLLMTIGFYQLVCNFLNTFGVQVEQATAVTMVA